MKKIQFSFNFENIRFLRILTKGFFFEFCLFFVFKYFGNFEFFSKQSRSVETNYRNKLYINNKSIFEIFDNGQKILYFKLIFSCSFTCSFQDSCKNYYIIKNACKVQLEILILSGLKTHSLALILSKCWSIMINLYCFSSL